MKKSDYLILLSTETPEQMQISKADIIWLHTNPPSLGGFGWNRPGIDYLVTRDGHLETIIPEDSPNEVDLWGIREGSNLLGTARYLAYSGGKSEDGSQKKDTRTREQRGSMAAVVKFYVRRFPDIQVLGFDQVPSKQGLNNPGFDVAKWCRSLGLSEANIYKPDNV